jgi:hypothetical protein
MATKKEEAKFHSADAEILADFQQTLALTPFIANDRRDALRVGSQKGK